MTRYSLPFLPSKIYYREIVLDRDEFLAAVKECRQAIERIADPDSPFVFLYAYNHPKTLAAYCSILDAGKCCVLIDPETGSLERDEINAITPPGALVIPDCQTSGWDPDVEFARPKAPAPAGIEPIEPRSTLVYTSGEDGYSKPACITLDNLLADAHAIVGANRSEAASVACAAVPLHHLFGLATGALGPSLVGAGVVITDPSQLVRIRTLATMLSSLHVTHFYSVPLVLYLLAKVPNVGKIISNVEYVTSGAYKLSRSLFDTYESKFGVRIREGYGLTEGSPVCAWNHPGKYIKQGSVGQPFSCCEIRVVTNAGALAAVGEPGEVIVRGKNVVSAYYGFPQASREKIRDGWLYTGDIGYWDEDGYLYLCGLKKRMLNIRGKKAFPAEIERLILSNESVEHIDVFGKSSELEGDRMHARVVFRSRGEEQIEQLRAWCAGKITPYKIPVFEKAW